MKINQRAHLQDGNTSFNTLEVEMIFYFYFTTHTHTHTRKVPFERGVGVVAIASVWNTAKDASATTRNEEKQTGNFC